MLFFQDSAAPTIGGSMPGGNRARIAAATI
jgi:hypothetical protein